MLPTRLELTTQDTRFRATSLTVSPLRANSMIICTAWQSDPQAFATCAEHLQILVFV